MSGEGKIPLRERKADELRKWSFEVGYAPYAEGSVLVRCGNTVVLCTATVEDRIPGWLVDKNQGWVTAEYAMLPRSTQVRTRRDHNRTNGRVHEIQRLIGRSLRAVTDLEGLGIRQITIDCDVIQADAGTRTASITGGWIALAMACNGLMESGVLETWPLVGQVAAVSLGICGGEIRLDLDYEEDSTAEVDLNLVMTADGKLVEIQGTAETRPFEISQLNKMLEVGKAGLRHIFALQREALSEAGVSLPGSKDARTVC